MAAPLRAAKQELRKRMRPALKSLTELQRREESELIVKKFLASEEYQSSKRISIYLSMPTEVDTNKILQDIFDSGRLCFIPRYEGAGMDMLRVHSLEDITSLPKDKWNIRQPEGNAGQPSSQAAGSGREEALSGGGLDLLVVPGLAFNKEGHRLGRGKGYYDSYYAKCIQAGSKPKTIALAFSVQLCDSIPMTEKDIVVGNVIFPHE